jgi:hypothetical protein
LPLFSTCRQIGGEQFYELKLLKLIGLYITYIPVTFQWGSREEIFVVEVKHEKVIAINQVKKIFLNLNILTSGEIVFSTIF